jgi:hypothetical protein
VNTSHNAALKRLSRKLGAVIDVTRTIDRNSDDGIYSDQGDEIVYVFDTNVVQIFLEPYKNPEFSQVFHTPLWSEGKKNEADREINAQTSLLIAEYLMSGTLPGQKDGRWSMTRAHYREMQAQIEHLAGWGKEISSRIRDDQEFFGAFALDRLRELNAALILNPTDGRETFLRLAERQGLPDDAIRQIADLSDDAFRERAIGIRSREVCRLLAQDWILEPADQIIRLLSDSIAGKYLELEHLIGASADDWKEIRNESQAWREAITLVQDRGRKTKAGQALTADCDALAMVAWANRQKTPQRRRVLFVTGDRTLLDACRHRYVEAKRPDFFFVRPITHFAPIFNSKSAVSKLATQEAFQRLREVLEATMVPLNLGLLAGEDPERRLRSRDAFALAVDRSVEGVLEALTSSFPGARDIDWARNQEKALGRLVSELRVIELLMLEAFPHLIAERLNKERERFRREAANAGSDALADAIDQRFESAKGAGIKFSVRMMSDAVEQSLKQIDFTRLRTQRAPIQIRLSFSDSPDTHMDYVQTVEWLKVQSAHGLQDMLQRLAKRPASMFALAALLALSLEVWSDTDRYAGLAVAAAEETLRDDATESARSDLFEFRFLRAASLRFRLASFRPQEGSSYNDIWSEWLNTASEILDECVQYHAAAGQTSRQMRALSERAALHGAYSEWYAFGKLASLKSDEEASTEAIASLREAVENLATCAQLSDVAEARVRSLGAVDQEISRSILEAATRQYKINILAVKAAGERLAAKWPGRKMEIEEVMGRLPAGRNVDWPNMPIIAQAYQLASKRKWNELIALPTDSLTLALDFDVVRGLQTVASAAKRGGQATRPGEA